MSQSEQTELSTEQVVKTLRDARFVMLTTALEDGKLLAHPMTPQQVTDEADVYFFVGLDTDQVKALQGNPNVNIAVSESGSWLSVAGSVEFLDDRAKKAELWDEAASAYYEQGVDDPNLGLILVRSESAQYWGVPGGKLAGAVSYLRAKLSGERPAGTSATTEL